MPSVFTRVLLLLSSYSPLLLILAIQNKDRPSVLVGLSVTATASVGWLFMFLRRLRSLNRMRITVRTAVRRDQDVIGYLFAYLFPFLGIDLGKPSDVLALGILFLVVAVLYVRLNAIYINPLLAIAGYYLNEITEDNGKTSMLLTRRSYVAPNSVLKVSTAGTLVAMEVKDESDR